MVNVDVDLKHFAVGHEELRTDFVGVWRDILDSALMAVNLRLTVT